MNIASSFLKVIELFFRRLFRIPKYPITGYSPQRNPALTIKKNYDTYFHSWNTGKYKITVGLPFVCRNVRQREDKNGPVLPCRCGSELASKTVNFSRYPEQAANFFSVLYCPICDPVPSDNLFHCVGKTMESYA